MGVWTAKHEGHSAKEHIDLDQGAHGTGPGRFGESVVERTTKSTQKTEKEDANPDVSAADSDGYSMEDSRTAMAIRRRKAVFSLFPFFSFFCPLFLPVSPDRRKKIHNSYF